MFTFIKRKSAFLATGFFGFALIFFGELTPAYSHSANAISELGMPSAVFPLAFNLTAFILPGALVTLCSIFYWQNMRVRILSVMIAISGIGLVGLGIFPAADDFVPSLQTSLHFGMVALNFLAFTMAAFVAAWKFRRSDGWKQASLVSAGIALLSTTSFFIPTSLLPAGVSQRLALAMYFFWLCMLNWLALTKNNG